MAYRGDDFVEPTLAEDDDPDTEGDVGTESGDGLADDEAELDEDEDEDNTETA